MSTSTLFPPDIEAYRDQIDSSLERYLQFDNDTPKHLAEAIRYAVLSPGKRFRPLLLLTATEMCGGTLHAAIPAACAVELIHNYSLIHDDLPAMDDDDLRRGRATCHVMFDEATAILAGDALIPLAFEILATEIASPALAARCVAILAKAAGSSELVGGQADDLGFQFVPSDLSSLERIHRRKTGALIAASLEMGGVIAGASTEKLKNLTDYGKHLGLAFQIVDDLLDLRGSEDKMGKHTGKDAELGKLTYPAVLGESQSEQRALEIAQQAIDSLSPFGDKARPLELLARFVVDRTQ